MEQYNERDYNSSGYAGTNKADTDYWGSSNGYYCYITGDGRG